MYLLLIYPSDTLEQIDISHLLMDKYSDVSIPFLSFCVRYSRVTIQTFSLARTAADIKSAIAAGKIAGIIGLEG